MGKGSILESTWKYTPGAKWNFGCCPNRLGAISFGSLCVCVCVCVNPIYAAFETVQYILVTILQQAEGGQMGPEKKNLYSCKCRGVIKSYADVVGRNNLISGSDKIDQV